MSHMVSADIFPHIFSHVRGPSVAESEQSSGSRCEQERLVHSTKRDPNPALYIHVNTRVWDERRDCGVGAHALLPVLQTVRERREESGAQRSSGVDVQSIASHHHPCAHLR